MQILDPIGNPASSDWILIQPVDDHDQEMLPQEMEQIRALLPDESFALFPVKVDWFRNLAPWTAPGITASPSLKGADVVIGGYSLAGFFALWAGYQTDAFEGIVAASPSVWYPGWDEYRMQHRFRIRNAYLSLGDREERTKNPVMRTVGDRIREQYRLLESQGIRCILEWNEGNHFMNPDKRTAAGFAWVMK